MKSVFVTGANGLLGTNLVLMLVEQGFAVKALVRRKDSFIKFHHTNLKLIEGDLQNTDLLINEIMGCQYVAHIAANTSQGLLKLADYYSANIQGTQNIIDACKVNRIEKLVYISTANIFSSGDPIQPSNENSPMNYPFSKMLYVKSKKRAQDLIDKASEELNITSICPSFMLGEYDTKPSSGKIILMALNKRLVFYPTGGKSFVHVKDVPQGIINAFNQKQSGQKYILSNENLSYKKFYSKLINQTHQKTTLIPIPNLVLLMIGLTGEILRFFRVQTDLSFLNLKALTVRNYFSNHKAKQELKIQFTPIDEAIKDAVDYFEKS
ncbi:NAD-dependent epimerase/dehydratase family protein [Carboxylicivirga linearis]|uniref:NAD-dependent epimerase/dehydratase family protein n=1 Tax=Carboxylicivirga linearis TaxID=1628157 RepID=A0ABS5JRA4_9BACT|nr:NAD-dependent epimerase/dehydratase family protein [Carboxylicivirga linearis]MBS2097343.1 NAD-dependent epimerase/dehydratase family protein [Carboxylicivirga linearis]